MRALLLGALSACLTLSACGKQSPRQRQDNSGNIVTTSGAPIVSDFTPSSPAVLASPSAPPSELDQEKQIAQTDPTFTSPFMLWIDHDDYNEINSSTPPSTPPCVLDPDSWANIIGFSVNHVAVANWLVANGIIEARNTGLVGHFCRIITAKILPYADNPNQAGPGAYHGTGIRAPIIIRACTRWTYAKEYQIDMPGKGQVKVFAGTYNYRLITLVPWITTAGEGTASIKMYLDPDTGHWQASTQLSPGNTTMTMITNPDGPRPTPKWPVCPGP